MQDGRIKQILEAVIFAADHPLSMAELGQVLESVQPEDLARLVGELNQEYRDHRRAFAIAERGGGYQYVTNPDLHEWVRKLYKGRRKARLSQAALETLAIVAYKQPVSRPAIEAIRGVGIDGVLQTLLERRLVTMAGRGSGPGRPLLYKTTKEFLTYFGINSLDELPHLSEIKEIFHDQALPIRDQAGEASGEANGVGDAAAGPDVALARDAGLPGTAGEHEVYPENGTPEGAPGHDAPE